MEAGQLFPSALFRVGPLQITSTVVTTWGIIAAIWLGCWLLSRRLQTRPGAAQTLAEGVMTAIEEAIRAVAPDHVQMLLPFIASLWIFLVIANLCGLIPGIHSPTRDLSATAALAILVFLSVHWFGIRSQGLRRYLHHYLTPTPILLPFHLISEVTRTVALAVRLFGNIMSLEMAALLILLVAGFLAPIPILMLHIIEALVQAYIFGMLALIYVAGGLQSQMLREQRKENEDGEGQQR
ncbi:F-type H+-transporting ATPase subunit a [Microbulbifer donghaiensis]|uniref:ATP synthase subunit a n=1 Tax=Microbulbifer donghaiensis TaxID=494016 RepID=A0A1M4UM04_9GAMM|nr:F0F1 ATP synthase subunit A [Microbulbifer donghaiensis]SHE57759.1 F-type H+-transporting ATPase subunit a [Microbulbifer donghaiensis]